MSTRTTSRRQRDARPTPDARRRTPDGPRVSIAKRTDRDHPKHMPEVCAVNRHETLHARCELIFIVRF